MSYGFRPGRGLDAAGRSGIPSAARAGLRRDLAGRVRIARGLAAMALRPEPAPDGPSERPNQRVFTDSRPSALGTGSRTRLTENG